MTWAESQKTHFALAFFFPPHCPGVVQEFSIG